MFQKYKFMKQKQRNNIYQTPLNDAFVLSGFCGIEIRVVTLHKWPAFGATV